MSHFAGLVILTAKYAKNNSLEDSLNKYDERLKVPEYSKGKVSEFDKVSFIEYYAQKDNRKELQEKHYNNLLEQGKIHPYDGKGKDMPDTFEKYCNELMSMFKDEYVELFKSIYPDLFAKFDELYQKNGNDWNSCHWRISETSGCWEEYSTYNPNSKFDWYDCCGRWSGCLKTKSGEYVNECLLGEIDWTDFKPEDYEDEEKEDWLGKKYKPLKEDVMYHFTKSAPPFCLVVDGQWFEKGKMLYWAITENEISKEDWSKQFFEILEKLPEDSFCYNIDFHI